VFAGLLRQFENQVTTIATIANSAQQSLTGAQRVFEILDAPVDIKSKPNARRLPRAQGTIRFEGVGFGYHAENSVLQRLTSRCRLAVQSLSPERMVPARVLCCP
jgi:ATP-binding cassette subfamily B protein